jgi:uncharacterized membrane protein YvbJ
MRRCPCCGAKSVDHAGLCYRCGRRNTEFDFWADRWGNNIMVVLAILVCLFGAAVFFGYFLN